MAAFKKGMNLQVGSMQCQILILDHVTDLSEMQLPGVFMVTLGTG